MVPVEVDRLEDGDPPDRALDSDSDGGHAPLSAKAGLNKGFMRSAIGSPLIR